jgi:hypothetical protein
MLWPFREDFGSEQFFDANELNLHRVATSSGRRVRELERARKLLAMIALNDERYQTSLRA